MSARELIQVARDAIAAHLAGASAAPQRMPPDRAGDSIPASGVFVTLWTEAPEGKRLRGCIGRFGRQSKSLFAEIASCAVLAAVEDPRFPPVTLAELPTLDIEISLLGPNEKIEDGSRLDPHRYGVIMTSRTTGRQATLLPGIEGIDTVEVQLKLVRQKAGIAEGEAVDLHRYEVKKVSDERET